MDKEKERYHFAHTAKLTGLKLIACRFLKAKHQEFTFKINNLFVNFSVVLALITFNSSSLFSIITTDDRVILMEGARTEMGHLWRIWMAGKLDSGIKHMGFGGKLTVPRLSISLFFSLGSLVRLASLKGFRGTLNKTFSLAS
ncbi:hypothetical protein NC653_013222 [Populus alba x Populus x berolinensis]|uniref:Uncharacterized protein n=1 Tax=Populus alba x Populus x berolinensis TaxID=444605 RepID=A0AAD6QTZ3_9ROSI|nr:hypothetical protein NC653_013222 [Populus alba x Populus x berolinensis]